MHICPNESDACLMRLRCAQGHELTVVDFVDMEVIDIVHMKVINFVVIHWR
jgi:hypothetical protein